eukprot:gene10204-2623_t
MGFSDEEFKIELFDDYGKLRSFGQKNQYKSIHMLLDEREPTVEGEYFDEENEQNYSIKKQVAIADEEGEQIVNKIYQIDLLTNDLEKTKDFYKNQLKMKIFFENEKQILFGYDEDDLKLLLKFDEKFKPDLGLKEYSNVQFYINNLNFEKDMDPNGYSFLKYVKKESEGSDYINWNLRKLGFDFKIRYFIIALVIMYVVFRPSQNWY